MANVNEKDVDSGGGEDVTNFRIRTKLLSTCSGAGVNAASSVNLLAFATTDHPLSELVWSPHTGLSLKCANRGDDAKKPFLLWNVGPSSMERGNGDDHDLIIDKELVAPSHDVVEREADSFHPQTVQTDQSRIEVAGVVPEAPAEGSCMGSRRRGKALSDGDIYRRSSDEEDDSVESSMSTRLTPKGVKRKICDEDAILGSKKMKKQIHGSDGSTFVMKPDSSFMKWISNMMTNRRPHPNNEDSESPLPLACANDVYSKNFVCFKPRGSAAASISMGFQAVLQSLYCRETDELSAGEEKVVEPIDVSREGAVDGVKSPENIHVEHLAKDTASDGMARAADALGEETKIPEREACPNTTVGPSKPRTSLWITRLATNTLRSEKGKEIAEETIGCSSYGVSPTHRTIATSQNKASRTEMFDAIRSLRLSRADVIRWMDSEAPLRDLEGFFVRLRLAGIGGGSYYVGCITGESTSNKSILVDVGGVKSSIATQYVSNHDFLEDEIKAWWNRSLGSGRRIPSLAELNSKFNNRHTLGRPTMDGGRRTDQ
ncbi:uncharacterized protein LOC125194228 isoform X2 [Salvia hispanica]|uniref:uncharacterized protein LOC125194228 isoform X2 n=1 Tax=Salvia hispanica TaxID=49212 RepID=UPI0020096C92|nr:uncharacterized protein LOC125194228 isoform X2 [Salvia hispanica]